MKCHVITKTCLFKYIENFTSKNQKCSDEKLDIFRISAQNIDCGYSLEPPHVYPCKPQFYYIKVGFTGVKLYRYVFVLLIFFFLKNNKKILQFLPFLTRFRKRHTVATTPRVKTLYVLQKGFEHNSFHFLIFDHKTTQKIWTERSYFSLAFHGNVYPHLTLSTLGKIFSRRHFEIFFFLFYQENMI